MTGYPILSLLVLAPLAGAVAILAVRGDRPETVRRIALAAMAVTAVLAAQAFDAFVPGEPGYQFTESRTWIPSLGVGWRLGADGAALLMIALTALLSPVALIASWRSVEKRVREYAVALLVLESAMIGVFASLDLLLFYVFWEVMLVPMALLIGIWGGDRRVHASMKFFLYTVVGSFPMFLAILYVWNVQVRAGHATFDVATLAASLPLQLSATEQFWLFLAFALAFAIKVPLFPLHTWLPDAHVQAPTAGSVILAGVLLKMGAFGFLRYAIPFFPQAATACAGPILALAVAGILYGALMALAQDDLKKMIAYSSVSHLGFVMLGLFTFTTQGVSGAILQMVNHGLSTGALFLLVGVLYDRAHRRGIDDFGGLARTMPVFAVALVLTTMSSVAMPGLNGFVGEFLVLAGTFRVHRYAAAAAGLAMILGAVYMLSAVRRILYGPAHRADTAAMPDLARRERVALAPLAAGFVVLGLWPNLLLDRIEPDVRRFLERRAAMIRHADAGPAPGTGRRIRVAERPAPAGEARR